jgi:hypothetical protein
MANVFLWSIPLAMRGARARFLGLWAIRLQVLLAYAVTAAHKLTGTHWLDGSALAIAATDAAFGPSWMADAPMLARLGTWAVLAFQVTFPIALWFGRLRPAWLVAGVLFHAATAVWMDIPEMGLAFIACYAIWLDDAGAARIAGGFSRLGTLQRR